MGDGTSVRRDGVIEMAGLNELGRAAQAMDYFDAG